MLSIGALIWISCRPLIRLILCASCGFIITKADIFPPVAARGAGQIMLNVALPCLMFSKIVPAFTSQNIGALGPLVLVAVMYELIGVIIAWIVKQLFWVPHRFRYGILVAGGWGNVGDIPTSVLLSITSAAPFNGTSDENLSVAYISAFILVFMVTLFPCGAHRWVAMDYKGPEVEPEEVRDAIRAKRRMVLYGWPRVLRSLITFNRTRPAEVEKLHTSPEKQAESDNIDKRQTGSPKHVSFHEDPATAAPTEDVISTPAITSRPNSIEFQSVSGVETTSTPLQFPSNDASKPKPLLPTAVSPISDVPAPHPAIPQTTRQRTLRNIQHFFKSLFNTPSIAIFLAFPIALVPPLKALFVTNVPGTHIPSAPDGQPPLAFIIDTTTFIGGASVPLGLICLGSALARLKVPTNQWKTLPNGAIISLAVGKLIITPVLGVLICEKIFVKTGFIAEEDKVLRFVCIFFSCLPTATTQVFLTQVYSGTGSAEHLSAFLIPQYILMFISMTALTAYTILLIF